MVTQQKIYKELCSKKVLEKAFGNMSNEMYASIMTTIQNEFQNIVNNDRVPTQDSFIQSLSATVEFHRNRLSHM